MMYANELPQFADSKSALSNRFLVLKFNKSFYGKEDLKLESRLANERAGILNWALTGLDRLQDDFRGKLPNCSSGLDELEEIKKSTDSVYHFYHEVCMKSVEIGGYTHAKDLYDAYRTFCIEEGRQAYSAIHFGRTITKLLNQLGVDTVRKQEGRYYKNLKVNDAKVDLFN
jgi:putative DNA primase/helicase